MRARETRGTKTGNETMDAKTKEMLKGFVATSGNDAEKAAKWAARNMRAIGGIKFWRAAIAEAMQG